MASEIRVNQIQSRTGLSTVSFTDTGAIISGVTTVSDALTVSGGITADLTGNVTGNLTGTASTATAAATAYGLSGSPTLSGITSVSTTNLTVNGNAYPATGPLSNRNLIINGAMQVWQRSTSVAGVADNTNEGYQSVDRYGFSFGSTHGGACTISKSTTVPSGEGFAQSYKVDVTTSATPTANQATSIFTKIEAQDIANSGWNFTSTSSYVTLSFWARSTKAGTYCAYIDSADAATYIKYVKEYTLVANTWKKVEITIPGESTLVYNNDNGEGLNVFWVLSAGSNRNASTNATWETGNNVATSNQVNFFDSDTNDFYLTGVQLEVGSVATPFEHRSYGDEFLRCQRYYVNTNWVFCTSITALNYRKINPGPGVRMRTSPTHRYSHPSTGVVNQVYEHSSASTYTINDASNASSPGPQGSTYFGMSTTPTYDVLVRIEYSAEL